MIETVVSGGQTGVDRAGLDAALEAGIPVGGWAGAGVPQTGQGNNAPR